MGAAGGTEGQGAGVPGIGRDRKMGFLRGEKEQWETEHNKGGKARERELENKMLEFQRGGEKIEG